MWLYVWLYQYILSQILHNQITLLIIFNIDMRHFNLKYSIIHKRHLIFGYHNIWHHILFSFQGSWYWQDICFQDNCDIGITHVSREYLTWFSLNIMNLMSTFFHDNFMMAWSIQLTVLSRSNTPRFNLCWYLLSFNVQMISLGFVTQPILFIFEGHT